MHGGAHVVREPGQRELGSARAAADRVRRLEDEHRGPGLRQKNGSREAIRPRANDDDVAHAGVHG